MEERMKTKTFCTALVCLQMLLGYAQPFSPDQLQLRVTIQIGDDLGLPRNTTYNPRWFDGKLYLVQINTGSTGIGRYRSGYPTPEVVVDNSAVPIEHRTLVPFRGAYKDKYMLGGGGAKTGGVSTTMSRYNADGSNRVDVETPDSVCVEGFDWVDDDTIICTVYTSGLRNRIYMFDVNAEPFSLTRNTTWNAQGYIVTSVTTRIRNVRVGDTFKGYAYYGDAGQNDYPNFYALNLATGQETLLGNAGPLTGTGSYGLWTVVERGGYLFVQTTDNGIQVYKMLDATTLGPLEFEYGKYDLDSVTGYYQQYYGFDVAPDGKTMVLGAAQGFVFELGQPILNISTIDNNAVLSWPESVTAVVLQSSPTLTPPAFTDMDPQPEITVSEKMNTVTVPASSGQTYYRLRRFP